MPAGYSGRPLAAKLGLKAGERVWRENIPASVAADIARNAPTLHLLSRAEAPIDHAHIFVERRADLADALARLRPLLTPAGMLWVSWPKRASKVPTDITEDRVRELAFPYGFVDVKVCAIDERWLGLKLVVRLAERR